MADLQRERPFGRTGFPVTALTLGTSSWGPARAGETAEARDARLAELAAAFLRGTLPTNAIDTSNIYGGSESEAHIGRALALAGGLGDDQLLQTKLDRDIPSGRFDAGQMERSLEQSLERLGVDRLQVLFLHDPEGIGFDAAMAPGGPVEALVAMKERGVAASIGISGGPVDMLQQFVETDIFDALITHNRYTLVDRSAGDLLEAAAARNLGINNAATYGGGILTGDPRFAGSYGYAPIRPAVQKAVDAVEALCREAGISIAAAALQFSLRDPRIHSTIVGVTSLGRFDDLERECAETIPDGFWDAVDAAVPPASAALDA
ncbi:MAG TPA: aldo/keto reductase [Galbitalea sp.]|jgi:D-threo-aldose 1-dehydrogenase